MHQQETQKLSYALIQKDCQNILSEKDQGAVFY